MELNLALVLPIITPKAITWANERSADIAAGGTPLTREQVSLAARVGVQRPELVRLSFVSEIPLPDDPLLAEAARMTGLLGPQAIGLTLGHGIYIRHGYLSIRLLSHELRHVYQYEQAGSVSAYLPIYLRQILEFGYREAPYEIDARQHEMDA